MEREERLEASDPGELAPELGALVLDRRQLAQDVRRLSRLQPTKALASIALQWLGITLAAGAAMLSGHPLVYALAIVFIATRQHALVILMHDGAHWRLLPDRRWNDLVSDLLLAFPIGVSTTAYRRTHMAHHRYLNTPGDPDLVFAQANADLWSWPKRAGEALRLFLGDVLGVNALRSGQAQRWGVLPRLLPGAADPLSLRERALFVGLAVLAAVTLLATGWWVEFALLWLLPLATLLPALTRLRAVAEHACVENRDELSMSREALAGGVERTLFAPCHINLHLSHHLFPSVPFYNLPALHERLMQDEAFRAGAHQTRGYLLGRRSVLSEILRPAEG